ncbi:hypothetical protein LJR164_001583 [Phenylobacterium sp. LjRoot164]|uniref:hypothetical protein n=1 Tax=unclassified Phenylobacterium TaxID=2640670 RepID=UPI003ECF2B24
MTGNEHKGAGLPEVLDGHWNTAAGREMAVEYAAMDKSRLTKSDVSDFALANAVYMADRGDLDLIVWQTAAKERIRWLSVQLATKDAELSALREEHADQVHEVVAALYKAWPDAEDIPSDWPNGIIGCIEQIIAERDAAQAPLEVCRLSLVEQGSARRDPTMPVLIPEVIDALEGDAEAQYAMAMNSEERRAAHGLSLLVNWQRVALTHQEKDAQDV